MDKSIQTKKKKKQVRNAQKFPISPIQLINGVKYRISTFLLFEPSSNLVTLSQCIDFKC